MRMRSGQKLNCDVAEEHDAVVRRRRMGLKKQDCWRTVSEMTQKLSPRLLRPKCSSNCVKTVDGVQSQLDVLISELINQHLDGHEIFLLICRLNAAEAIE